MTSIHFISLSSFTAALELTYTHKCTEPFLCSDLTIRSCSAESHTLSVHPTYQNRVTALMPGDSYWTIIVSEIPSRCLNKPSNRAIILKQKVTSGVTTGPEINKAPNYDRSTGPIFGLRSPAFQVVDQISRQPHSLSMSLRFGYQILFQDSLLHPSLKMHK